MSQRLRAHKHIPRPIPESDVSEFHLDCLLLILILVIGLMSDIRNGASSGPPGPSEPSDQQKDPAAASPSTKGKFKIATRVIMAMKRFQGNLITCVAYGPLCMSHMAKLTPRGVSLCLCAAASLNPTYSYGKRTSDSAGHVEHVCILCGLQCTAADGLCQPKTFLASNLAVTAALCISAAL